MTRRAGAREARSAYPDGWGGGRFGLSAIHVFSVFHTDNFDSQYFSEYRINDAVNTDPEAVAVFRIRQFFGAVREWILRERINFFKQQGDVLFR